MVDYSKWANFDGGESSSDDGNSEGAGGVGIKSDSSIPDLEDGDDMHTGEDSGDYDDDEDYDHDDTRSQPGSVRRGEGVLGAVSVPADEVSDDESSETSLPSLHTPSFTDNETDIEAEADEVPGLRNSELQATTASSVGSVDEMSGISNEMPLSSDEIPDLVEPIYTESDDEPPPLATPEDSYAGSDGDMDDVDVATNRGSGCHAPPVAKEHRSSGSGLKPGFLSSGQGRQAPPVYPGDDDIPVLVGSNDDDADSLIGDLTFDLPEVKRSPGPKITMDNVVRFVTVDSFQDRMRSENGVREIPISSRIQGIDGTLWPEARQPSQAQKAAKRYEGQEPGNKSQAQAGTNQQRKGQASGFGSGMFETPKTQTFRETEKAKRTIDQERLNAEAAARERAANELIAAEEQEKEAKLKAEMEKEAKAKKKKEKKKKAKATANLQKTTHLQKVTDVDDSEDDEDEQPVPSAKPAGEASTSAASLREDAGPAFVPVGGTKGKAGSSGAQSGAPRGKAGPGGAAETRYEGRSRRQWGKRHCCCWSYSTRG
eukprot:jgi/Botrbrau1/6259/Bobra.0129s0011.1